MMLDFCNLNIYCPNQCTEVLLSREREREKLLKYYDVLSNRDIDDY